MSTTKQIKHLLTTDVFKIKTKVKSFQKPKRDTRYKNKGVRG